MPGEALEALAALGDAARDDLVPRLAGLDDQELAVDR